MMRCLLVVSWLAGLLSPILCIVSEEYTHHDVNVEMERMVRRGPLSTRTSSPKAFPPKVPLSTDTSVSANVPPRLLRDDQNFGSRALLQATELATGSFSKPNTEPFSEDDSSKKESPSLGDNEADDSDVLKSVKYLQAQLKKPSLTFNDDDGEFSADDKNGPEEGEAKVGGDAGAFGAAATTTKNDSDEGDAMVGDDVGASGAAVSTSTNSTQEGEAKIGGEAGAFAEATTTVTQAATTTNPADSENFTVTDIPTTTTPDRPVGTFRSVGQGNCAVKSKNNGKPLEIRCGSTMTEVKAGMTDAGAAECNRICSDQAGCCGYLVVKEPIKKDQDWSGVGCRIIVQGDRNTQGGIDCGIKTSIPIKLTPEEKKEGKETICWRKETNPPTTTTTKGNATTSMKVDLPKAEDTSGDNSIIMLAGAVCVLAGIGVVGQKGKEMYEKKQAEKQHAAAAAAAAQQQAYAAQQAAAQAAAAAAAAPPAEEAPAQEAAPAEEAPPAEAPAAPAEEAAPAAEEEKPKKKKKKEKKEDEE